MAFGEKKFQLDIYSPLKNKLSKQNKCQSQSKLVCNPKEKDFLDFGCSNPESDQDIDPMKRRRSF
jgi:hypothetical protein